MKTKTDKFKKFKNGRFYLYFKEQGESFTLDVPHKNRWDEVIRHLESRGFKISTPKYYTDKNNNALADFNKLAIKNDVVVLFEIQHSSIKLQFGYLNNLWENTLSIWENEWDERYTHPTYLQRMARDLEILRFKELVLSWGIEEEKTEEAMTVVEKILHKERINPHIHGGNIKTLEDIGKSITEDSYNYGHNSNDANNKKILCGETKYFYDSHMGRLMCGVVYHNINNMWWVLMGNKNPIRTNIASHRLFDYTPELLRKMPDARKVRKHLAAFEKKREYERCIGIRNFAQKLNIEL